MRLFDGQRPDLRRYTKKFTPLGDYVAVQVVRHDATKGGIVLPDGSMGQNSPVGWVVAVGPEVKHLMEGDLVIFSEQWIGVATNYDGDRFVMPHEKDLVGYDDAVRATLLQEQSKVES